MEHIFLYFETLTTVDFSVCEQVSQVFTCWFSSFKIGKWSSDPAEKLLSLMYPQFSFESIWNKSLQFSQNFKIWTLVLYIGFCYHHSTSSDTAVVYSYKLGFSLIATLLKVPSNTCPPLSTHTLLKVLYFRQNFPKIHLEHVLLTTTVKLPTLARF